MADSSSRPSRVGGNTTYVSAHGIADRTGLPFEDAYLLAKIVLEEGGGPVSCRGKGATLKKPTEERLVQSGLIKVDASSEFTQYVYLELNLDGPVRELLDAKFAGVRITPAYVTERARWAAVATQDAFDLVNACLSA